MITVHGVNPSPFVRKVLFTLEYKELEYTLVPVMPGSTNDKFLTLSPLGKIPVLQHDDLTICDSSIICRYLDQVFPQHSIYPQDPALQARASWFEEYADTVLIEACGTLFRERLLHPKLLGQPCDEAKVQQVLEEKLPPLLDYMESQTPESGYLVGDSLSIADISVITCFVQAKLGEFEVDAATHPKLAAYVQRCMDSKLLVKLMDAEKAMFGQ